MNTIALADNVPHLGGPFTPPPKGVLEFLQVSGLIDNIFTFVSILILCGFIFLLINRIVETVIKFYRFKFIISIDVNYDELTATLDNIISSSISDYVMLNGLYEQYIGEKQEAGLRQYVSNALDEQLSDTFLKKLEFIYNKDAIPDLLARRILTTISIYVAKNNAAMKK